MREFVRRQLQPIRARESGDVNRRIRRNKPDAPGAGRSRRSPQRRILDGAVVARLTRQDIDPNVMSKRLLVG
jgi:hypothetical protein